MRTGLYLCFFLSGWTGLVYQVLWVRRLSLTFGHSVLAVSTVLTAFMGGLALGAWLAGRYGGRRSPFKVYGALEIFIGIWAVLSLPLLSLVESSFVWMVDESAGQGFRHLCCFAGALAVLLPPTTVMGATLPLLTRGMARLDEVGMVLSRLYGINTLGATLGAACSGFLMLWWLGLKTTLLLAAALNLLIGVVALNWPSDGSEPAPTEKTVAGSPRLPVCLAVAGCASMIFEVTWTRGLCLSIGSSIYAFSWILVIFLGGVGLGSLLYRPGHDSRLGGVMLAIGVLGGLTLPALGLLPTLFLRGWSFAEQGFPQLLALEGILVGLVLGPPTLLMGLSFPLAASAHSRSLGRVGAGVAQLYSANTLGCIVGSFLAGFVLVPHWGVQNALILGALLYLGVAAVLLPRRWKLVCLLPALMLVWVPRWNPSDMTAGVAVYGGVPLHDQVPPVVYRDGVSATVSLHQFGKFGQHLSLRVNGKADVSTQEGDLSTQYLLGYLPGLLHPDPARVAVIGLGGGFTVEAVAQCPGVERIDCAELEPAVIELQEYWRPHNGNVLEDPRVRLVCDDGRAFLLGGRQKYDLIISEPSNPWIAGIGNLFTQDFYAIAKGRMNEGAIFCQWFNLYAVDGDDLRRVLASFFSVFQQGQVWQTSNADLILLGGVSNGLPDLAPVRAAWESSDRIQRHFFEMGLDQPEVLRGYYLFGREQALRLAGDIGLNTDDRPLLEYSAPANLHRRNLPQIQALLWSELEPQKADLDLGIGRFQIGHLDQARQILAGLPTHWRVMPLAAAMSPGDAPRLLASDPHLRLHLADLMFEKKRYPAAAELYSRALESPPPGSLYHLHLRLGLCLALGGRLQSSLTHFEWASGARPEASRAPAHLGDALIGLGRRNEAVEVLREALRRNPHDFYARAKLRGILGKSLESE